MTQVRPQQTQTILLTHSEYRRLFAAQLELIRALCQGTTLTDEEVLTTTPQEPPRCRCRESPRT